MEELLQSLLQLVSAVWDLLITLIVLARPWLPLIAWVAFWLFAVDWRRLGNVFWSGGWIGVVLIGIVWALVWGVVAPPETGRHYILVLSVSNFVGKIVYVAALLCIMLLCGAVQNSGLVDPWVRFEDDEPAPADHHPADAHAHHADAHAH